jgi:hypothetical protein
MELVVAVTVATMLITIVVSSTYVLHRGFIRNEQHAERIKSTADFMRQVSADALNPDIYPHHPADSYVLEEKTISMYANGGPVTYTMENGVFTIDRSGTTMTYQTISDFTVSYFDEDGYSASSDLFPHSCEMTFTFSDGETTQISMRL